MLVKRIAKISLLLLGTLSVINFFYFYFSANLPDNAFAISSQSESSSLVSYYFFSAMVLLSFYTGPWVFFSALVMAARFYYRRQTYEFAHGSTELSILALSLLSCLFVSLTIEPQLVGEGLAYYLNLQMSYPIFASLALVSSVLLVFSLAGWSWQNLKQICRTYYQRWQMLYQKLAGSFNFLGKKSQALMKDPVGQISYQYKMKLKNFAKPQDDERLDEAEVIETSAAVPSMDHAIQEELPIKKKANSKMNFDEMIDSLAVQKNDKPVYQGPDQQYFDGIIQCLEEKLAEFKIQGKIINILKGPVVDTFELELGPGVKVSKVTGISEDLSLALSGAPLRIVYPMKGKTTVGIEVPRSPREIIYLDDVLNTKEFKNCQHSLPVVLGQDAFGQVSVVDLAQMPHMLVAGSTGAGKSVFINTLLVSLLVKLDHHKMKLLLIDPKQLELALYAKLPHLLMPVITEAKMASYALLWACEEMERRYSILKEMGVRNIDGFNDKLDRASRAELAAIQEFYSDDQDWFLPHIVVIVDEFADLILTKVGKEIETNICRLAAKARAAGIHLIVATQRPSVDVITGLIKSNFPTRVSFRVTSPMDSRTILNSMGAEKLLGKGDLLYKHGIEMGRYHSAYIDEVEIENFIRRIYSQETHFDDSAMDFLERAQEGQVMLSEDSSSMGGAAQEDELYGEAVSIVTNLRAASASMLQRRLKIGYNRAANLIEMMERQGVVGPQQGSKPRKVLMANERSNAPSL